MTAWFQMTQRLMTMKKNNLRWTIVALAGWGVFLFAPFAHAVEITTDLEVDSIFFSTEEFVAGDHIRIYARVENHGTEDVIAYVTFRRGATAIGNSQLVSVRAGGLPDEVFVDFEVPREQFNIAATVHPDSAPDTNPSNNEKLTTIFTPTLDDDHDRVANAVDNCPAVANPEQGNADHDSPGDACDPDDDNDTLTDAQEAVVGTSPTDSDTDNDGVVDAVDVFPTDRSRTQRETPKPTFAPPPSPVVEEETVAAPEALVAEIMSATIDGETAPVIAPAPEVPQASVRERSRQASADAENRADALPGFWSFKNPLIAWVFWILLIVGAAALGLERMIGGKYKKMIVENEPASVVEKVAPVKPKRKPAPKKKRVVKKLPRPAPSTIDEPPAV